MGVVRMVHSLSGKIDEPLYTFAEVARYLHIPISTVRWWTTGGSYATAEGRKASEPIIQISGTAHGPRLSFSNLIELFVLRALCERHKVKLGDIRKAVAYAERKLGIERLLIHPELSTGGGDLLIDYYGELISLKRSGQIALKAILKDALKRVSWEDELPVRLFLSVPERGDRKTVFVDPRIRYGKPVVRGIETSILSARVDAGEALEDIARDYDLPLDLVTDALVFEVGLARAA